MSVLGSLLYELWPTINRYGAVENEVTSLHLATTLGWELHLSIEEGLESGNPNYAEIQLTVEQAKLVVEKMQGFIAMREQQGRA